MTEHNRVIIQGSSAPGEVWSVNLNYVGPVLITDYADLLAWATAIGTNYAVITIGGLQDLVSAQGAVTGIRTEYRAGPSDTLVQAAEYALPVPDAGTGTATKPLQSALVISLLTGRPGRSYRGRIYWPAWNFTQTTGFRFSGANIATWRSNFVNLNTMIKAQAAFVEPTSDLQLVVHSRTLGTDTVVTTVSVGDVPDVQRRRRDDLVEISSVGPI